MRTFSGVDEYEKAVGTHLGHSEWHTITQEQVDLFADATGDHQWIHIDPERAAEAVRRDDRARLPDALADPDARRGDLPRRGLRMGVNYGANKVRFPAPVPVGSRVRAGAELLSLDRGPAGARATVRVTIEREGGESRSASPRSSPSSSAD